MSLERHETHAQAIADTPSLERVSAKCLWRICVAWACQNGRSRGSQKKGFPKTQAARHDGSSSKKILYVWRCMVPKKMAFQKRKPHAFISILIGRCPVIMRGG